MAVVRSRAVAVYAVSRAAPAILALAGVSAYTRIAGPAAYGIYASVVAAVGLADALLFEWLRHGLLRFWNAYPGNTLVPAVRHWFGALAAVVGVAGVIALVVTPQRARSFVALAAAVLVAIGWFELSRAALVASERPTAYGVVTVARTALATGLGAALALAGAGAQGLLVALLAGLALSPLLARTALGTGSAGGSPVAGVMPAMLRYAVPLVVARAFIVLMTYADRGLLIALLGARDAGIYAAGCDVAEQSVGMLLAVVGSVMVPRVFSAANDGRTEAARREAGESLAIGATLVLPCAVVLTVLRHEAAAIVFGADANPAAADVLAVAAWAAAILGVRSSYLDFSMQIAQRTWYIAGIAGLAAALNITLNLLLIPSLALRGALIAKVAAYVASVAATWVVARRLLPLALPLVRLTKIAVAAAVMALALVVASPLPGLLGLGARVALAGAVYVAALFSLRLLPHQSDPVSPGVA